MSYVDPFADTPAPSVARGQDVQSNAAQFGLMQQQRAVNALRGINIGDSDSVQRGINALTGLGMFDQAKAVTDLAQTRALNQANLPNIQATAAAYGRGLQRATAQDQSSDQQSPDDQSPDLTPDQLQQAQKTMQAAGEALARVKAAPPEQRAAVLDQELDQFQVAGINPQALANVKSHLTDASFADESIDQLTNHYAAHAENFGGIAQGGAPSANPSRHPADLYGPGTDLAASYLNDPTLMDPHLRGYAAHYLGVDSGPGIDTAVNLTANQRGVAAAGPQAYQTATGTNVANFNTLPAVERAVQKAAAEGRQAGTTQESIWTTAQRNTACSTETPTATPT